MKIIYDRLPPCRIIFIPHTHFIPRIDQITIGAVINLPGSRLKGMAPAIQLQMDASELWLCVKLSLSGL